MTQCSAPQSTLLPGKARLTAEQQREFEQNGFLVIRGALSPEEVKTYLDVIDRADQTTTHHVKGARTPGSPLEIRNCVSFEPESMLPLLTHDGVFPYLLDLMGPYISLTTSHLFVRPPTPDADRSFKNIGWHRDGPNPRPREVNGNEPWLYTKIGYFLTDLTVADAGALRVVPGSHRFGGNLPTDPENGEPYGAIEVKVRPGDAVIFENRLWHAVGPNYSTISRKNIYLGYCWRYLRPIDFITQPPELLAMASPEARQLLGDAGNALEFYSKVAELPLVGYYRDLVAKYTQVKPD